MTDPSRKEDDLVNPQVTRTARKMTTITVPPALRTELKRRAMERELITQRRVTIPDIIRELLGLPTTKDAD